MRSSRMARRTGTYPARTPTPTRASATATSVAGSFAGRDLSKLGPSRQASPRDHKRTTATPIANGRRVKNGAARQFVSDVLAEWVAAATPPAGPATRAAKLEYYSRRRFIRGGAKPRPSGRSPLNKAELFEPFPKGFKCAGLLYI
jgi:hypothetical protein